MIEQGFIVALGALAVWFSQSPSPNTQKLAPLLGLAAQPFWILATWRAEQWGMFGLSVVYTLAWLRGIRTHWSSR